MPSIEKMVAVRTKAASSCQIAEMAMLTLGLLSLLAPVSGMITGQTCNGGADQQWTFTDGLLSTAEAPGKCLTAVSPPTPYYILAMEPCGTAQSWQNWTIQPNNTIVLTSLPSQCVNLAAYGTQPGTQIWLADCVTGGCKGNCDWEPSANGGWRNSESGLVREMPYK